MTLAKLNQIIAVEQSVRNDTNSKVTQAHHLTQKPELFTGLARNYTPKDEEGEQFPPESTLVQHRVEDVLRHAAQSWTRLLDITATKDWANTEARASVTIGGQVIIEDAPVTFLIWLEKQLTDLRTFLAKLPVLDPSFSWVSSSTGDWATEPFETNRSKKVPRNHIKYPATDKHPAQVETFTEDVVVGTWSTTRFSGAIPISRKEELLSRVMELQEAVKFAREEANSREVTDQRVGANVFAYILQGSPA